MRLPGPLTAFTGSVLRRMETEYRRDETLTAPTVTLMYGAYAATIGAFAIAARRRSWPLPLPGRLARRAGTALATAGGVVAAGGAGRFGSGVEPGSFVTGGLYPQYSGLASAVAATAWAAFNRWIPSEERHLARIFGDEYRPYVVRTRRWS